jgi:two-component system, OmpR family, sensor kinase
MPRLSLRARLAIWCVAVVVVVVAAFATAVLVTQRQIAIRRIDGALAETQRQVARMLQEELGELDAPADAARETLEILASPQRPIAILDGGGAVLARRFDGPALADVFAGGRPASLTGTVASGGAAWRVQATRETLRGVPFVVVAASGLDEVARDQQDLRQAILVGAPLALLLAAAGGLWLATSGLRPITQMARRAASLPLAGAEDLGRPMRPDEVGQLTAAFNALLARLRAALQTQRQFMADASHELRSPVSIVRTAADVALSRDRREESEYREALLITATQARRLGTLVDDMLVLARADAGGYPLRCVDFFVDDAVDACLRAVGVLAAARRVAVAASGATDVVLHADPELIQRLLVNLLQNAVQHTPPGGAVTLSVSLHEADVSIAVSDSGSGIPPEQVDRIFERFVQLDPSRRGDGAGLGLTIARWIAEAHGGTLSVVSTAPGGATFRLTLPAGRVAGAQAAATAYTAAREKTLVVPI